MSALLYGLAVFLLIGYILTTLEFMIGNRSLKRLKDIQPLNPEGAAPRVSIIVPARNEERNIEEALTSLLHLNYPDYELILLNDRSEDNTGRILSRMSQQYPQLKVLHIQELPKNWLGKNHALYVGAQHATGELLLFTDADIVMKPSALSRAVQALTQLKLDHLALMPDLTSATFGMNVFMSAFSIYFSLYARPWFARFKKSPTHIGIGAFNLIRKEVYEAIGTHQAIALRPDDDMKLGKLVKKHSYHQDVLIGQSLVMVEWYRDLPEAIRGLMKNAFAGLNYSLPHMLAGITAQFLFGVWPVLGLLLSHGQTQAIYAVIIILMQILCLDTALVFRSPPWFGPLFPFSSLLIIYIVCRATILTYFHRGIFWRGTYYPLSQLRTS